MIGRILKKSIMILILIWLIGYGAFVLNILSKTHDTYQNPDAIIVLTGGNNRIATGLQLFSEKKAPKLFITGVNASVSDTDINALWTGDTPLPCCIEMGREATTTRENAIETKDWIEKNNIKSIILVTSDYHTDRALQEFRALIPHIAIHKHPVKEQKYSLKHLNFWKLTFSEYNKLIFRKVILTLVKKG